MQTYAEFFHTATRNRPYDWQQRLARDPECRSRLIDIPTGLGKTAGVVLAWLWNRLGKEEGQKPHKGEDWPRRLVYCLPMRTLVEQTADEVERWLFNLLHEIPDNEQLRWLCAMAETDPLPESLEELRENMRSPVILMGGEDQSSAKRDWDLYPEKPAILIGTQDMLLSRALNRGYGMSRYRWPMHFALLNNDCLWVMDEVQLMGSGLWTSAQLDWMREWRFKSQFPVKTWWMSATLGGDFLDTSDRRAEKLSKPHTFTLTMEEMERLMVLNACRPVSQLKLKSPKAKSKTARSVFDQIAADVADKHISGTLSLIVCNRVAIAQEIRKALSDREQTQTIPIKLLSSRFRPKDREDTLKTIIDFEKARRTKKSNPGLILVSTQVVEAGFDVSATRLWTQLAPWPSIIQRLGRLNRDGKSNESAQAFVFELPESKKDPGAALPYSMEDLKAARTITQDVIKLCQTTPDKPIRQILEELKHGPLKEKVRSALEPKPQPYPRAMDIHGLFSTEPDVFGGFTDVSPWVRNSDASADVTVFWRDFEDKSGVVNNGSGPGFQRKEGCPVAVYHLKKFLTGNKSAYQWNQKAEQWEPIRPDDICPGMTLLLPGRLGGYDLAQGWTGVMGGDLGPLPPPGPFEQTDAEDRETETGAWVPLENHLADAEKEAISIADELALGDTLDLTGSLVRGAALHDIGKSMEKWQEALLETHDADLMERANALWAKSPRGRSPFRPGFRHETASALAMWHRYYREGIKDDYPVLAIYLVAAHHGKARTVLAAREGISVPNVCGIPIPPQAPPVSPLPWPPGWQMDFTAAEDGASGEFNEDGTEFIFESPGWTGLVADLLGGWEKDAPARTGGAVPENEPAALGPFRLAFLETLLRAADGRASASAKST